MKTKPLHTPGPYEAVKATGGHSYAIFGPGPHDVVAHLPDCLPAETVAANARILKAAPELLEACKQLVAAIIPKDDGGAEMIGGRVLTAWQEARAAVEMVEGTR